MEDIHFQIRLVAPEMETVSNVSLRNDMTVLSILLVCLEDIAFLCWDMLLSNIVRVLETGDWTVFCHVKS